jgi:hypothetical protein
MAVMAACSLRIRAATETILATGRDDLVVSVSEYFVFRFVIERLRIAITCVVIESPMQLRRDIIVLPPRES